MKYIGSAWKESNILQPLNFLFELSPTVEPTALAQARATLPPLRKALAQQRDLLAALAGTFRTRGRCNRSNWPTCTYRLTLRGRAPAIYRPISQTLASMATAMKRKIKKKTTHGMLGHRVPRN